MGQRIDKKDMQILYEISLNARLPNKEIAKRTGLSPPAVQQRIRNLIDSEVISDFMPILRVDKLGLNLYRCMFRLERASNEQEEKIIQYFLQNRNVLFLAKVTGRWDLSVNFVLKDANALFEQLKEITRKFSDNIKAYHFSLIISSVNFNKRYLSNDVGEIRKGSYTEGSNEKEKLDEKDIRILRALFENTRERYFTITRQTGIAMQTVKGRIASMERTGVIQAYRTRINPLAFKASRKRVALALQDVSNGEQRLMEFVQKNQHVAVFEKMVGQWNYELQVECMGEEEFAGFLKELKDKLSDVLIGYDLIDVVHVEFNKNADLFSQFS